MNEPSANQIPLPRYKKPWERLISSFHPMPNLWMFQKLWKFSPLRTNHFWPTSPSHQMFFKKSSKVINNHVQNFQPETISGWLQSSKSNCKNTFRPSRFLYIKFWRPIICYPTSQATVCIVTQCFSWTDKNDWKRLYFSEARLIYARFRDFWCLYHRLMYSTK